MKNITKATVTLALGIGLLAGTAGIASATPHYTDWTASLVEEPVKVEQVVSFDQNRQPEVRTNNQMIGLEHGPGLHDSVHCLQNTKMQYHRNMTVLSMHDSVHCLHNTGAFLPWHRGFSRGLHNNGAFLPWHRG